jgi:hypothetical protein
MISSFYVLIHDVSCECLFPSSPPPSILICINDQSIIPKRKVKYLDESIVNLPIQLEWLGL